MIPLPWMITALLTALIAASATGYYYGGKHQADRNASQIARERNLVEKVRAATAEEISKIEIRNTTIRQKAEVITREVPVYRDCVHDDRTLSLLNAALQGATAESAVDGELPGADPTD